jgi:tetratricopeptide (TPR) repeat protein
MATDRFRFSLWSAAALAALAALAAALYLPYVHNPPVFDDKIFFAGYRHAEYAAFPLGLGLRFPPYFSLAYVQIMFGSIEAHRIVGLVLHAGCAWALYGLLRALDLSRLAAFAGAALFAVHPVAVYGAGYLTQRSIVVATLFALLALTLFLRGLHTGRISDALAAAVLYSFSVLSKEHAILLPAAAVALVPLTGAPLRYGLRYAGLFLAVCAPAATFVVLYSRGVIGTVYEPHFQAIAPQVAADAIAQALASPWFGSSLAQMTLFFKYLFVWLLPSTSDMSLDVRIDFVELWRPAVALPAFLFFVATPLTCTVLILRRSRLAVPAWGLLCVWLLFGTELAAVRFQEPFVLYRSYLWAPGLVVVAAWLLDRLPPRMAVMVLVPALLTLGWQARDRLQTFSSGLATWEDAAAKLPVEPVPGGYRSLYELGREYLYAGRPEDAIDVTERCIRQYPRVFDCAFARAAIQIEISQYERALPSMLYAISLRPDDPVARMHLGWVLENLGCRKEAMTQYRISEATGYKGAAHRLQSIETPGKGVLPPSRERRQVDCGALLERNPIPKSGPAR